MRKLLKGLVWVLAALVVVVVGGAYLLPGEVTLQRQAVINAPPEKVFALVASFKRFNEWSPWAELDPNTAYKYEGPEFGVGHKMSWASNDPNVGAGTQVVTEYTPSSRVAIDLDFGAMGKSASSWDIKPEGTGTSASWNFNMKLDGLMDRWLGLLIGYYVGADYDKGLAKLKALAEKEPAAG